MRFLPMEQLLKSSDGRQAITSNTTLILNAIDLYPMPNPIENHPTLD